MNKKIKNAFETSLNHWQMRIEENHQLDIEDIGTEEAEELRKCKIVYNSIHEDCCIHRFKMMPAATVVECVECGATFNFNSRW